jgi:hypothetical protein
MLCAGSCTGKGAVDERPDKTDNKSFEDLETQEARHRCYFDQRLRGEG